MTLTVSIIISSVNVNAKALTTPHTMNLLKAEDLSSLKKCDKTLPNCDIIGQANNGQTTFTEHTSPTRKGSTILRHDIVDSTSSGHYVKPIPGADSSQNTDPIFGLNQGMSTSRTGPNHDDNIGSGRSNTQASEIKPNQGQVMGASGSTTIPLIPGIKSGNLKSSLIKNITSNLNSVLKSSRGSLTNVRAEVEISLHHLPALINIHKLSNFTNSKLASVLQSPFDNPLFSGALNLPLNHGGKYLAKTGNNYSSIQFVSSNSTFSSVLPKNNLSNNKIPSASLLSNNTSGSTPSQLSNNTSGSTPSQLSNNTSGSTPSLSSNNPGTGLSVSAPPNSVVHTIANGNGQTVSFRNVTGPNGAPAGNTTATISLNAPPGGFTLNSTPTITVNDPEANLNPNVVNTVVVNVTSSSDPHGILVTLSETGPNTGVFTGSFSFTSSASSGSALQVSPGDNIRVSYDASHARFSETINGITQPGNVIITDYVVPTDDSPSCTDMGVCIPTSSNDGVPFLPIGGAVNVTVVGAQTDPNATDTVTMSYANDNIGDKSNINVIKIYQWTPEQGGWVPLDGCIVNNQSETVTCQTTTGAGETAGSGQAIPCPGTPTGPSGLFSLGVSAQLAPGGSGGGTRPGGSSARAAGVSADEAQRAGTFVEIADVNNSSGSGTSDGSPGSAGTGGGSGAENGGSSGGSVNGGAEGCAGASGGGGAGGGLVPLTGGSVVLDFVAPIASSSSGSGGTGATGGGGTGGTPTSTTTPTPGPAASTSTSTTTPTPGPTASTTSTPSITSTTTITNATTTKISLPSSATTRLTANKLPSNFTTSSSPSGAAHNKASPSSGSPIVTNMTLATNGSKPLIITLNGSDPNANGTLRFSIVSNPSLGNLSKINGTTTIYSLNSKTDIAATDTFTYKAIDNAGLVSNIGTVKIKINPQATHNAR